jgi:hypothetical protein
MTVVGEASDGEEAVAITLEQQQDIVLRAPECFRKLMCSCPKGEVFVRWSGLGEPAVGV